MCACGNDSKQKFDSTSTELKVKLQDLNKCYKKTTTKNNKKKQKTTTTKNKENKLLGKASTLYTQY